MKMYKVYKSYITVDGITNYDLFPSNFISEIEVVRETKCFVHYLGDSPNSTNRECRDSKSNSWWKWFNTKEEAEEYVTSTLTEAIKNLQKRLDNITIRK